MVIVAPRSARLVEANGARATPFGYVFVAGFVTMFPLWDDGIRTCRWRWAMVLVGIGVGAGRHAGIALTDRVGAGTARRDGVGHGRPPA